MSGEDKNILKLDSLLKLFSGSFLIRITYYFFGFINSVLLARFLGAEGYGVYVFVLSIAALLSVPTQFGMPILVMREFSALQALLLGLCLIPVLSLGSLRDAMLGGLRHIILAQLPESFIRPFLLMSGLLLAMFVVPVAASADNVIIFYVFCSLIAFFAGWALFNKRKPAGLMSASATFKTRSWFSAAFPIGLTAGMQVLNMQLSIVLLEFYSTDTEVAFYRVATLGASFVVIILQVSNTVVSPYVSRLHAQNDMRGIAKSSEQNAAGKLQQ